MAKEMQASRKAKELQETITEHEGYVNEALDQGKEDLALEVAEKIADFQSQLAIQTKAQESFAAHTERLKGMIKTTNKSLAEFKRQLVMVKTTESVQKATTAITHNYASGSSTLLTAKETLDRIKEKQQDLDDRLAAGEELQAEWNGEDLEDKLKEAGIVGDDSKAQDILAELKSKRA